VAVRDHLRHLHAAAVPQAATAEQLPGEALHQAVIHIGRVSRHVPVGKPRMAAMVGRPAAQFRDEMHRFD
jgi:hypothetical protein